MLIRRGRLKHASGLADQLSAAKSSGIIAVLKRIIDKITVQTNCIIIAVRTGALWSLTDIVDAEVQLTVIEVPVTLKQCGMAVRLIVQAPGIPLTRRPDPKMVALIAKAHQWFQKLSSGKYTSIEAIAKQVNVGSSYVTRVIYLAFLDPNIAQRIIRGDHPLELNAERLNRIVPLPIAWSEQRELLGMNE